MKRILNIAFLVCFLIPGFSQVKRNSNPSRPNILFAIMDDVTYQHMSAYGCSWVKTPNFDRIAKMGLLFKNAYTPNAKCAPSRSCILTGRNSWQLEEAGNHWSYFPSKFETFTEILSKNGYDVAFTGKGLSPVIAYNADGKTIRQPLIKAYNQIKTTPPTKNISNVDYAANFSAFLKSTTPGKPFFFWYGGLEPHRSYEYASGIKKGGKKLADIPDSDVYPFWPKVDSVRTDMLDYAFEIEYFDQQLGKMLKMLEDNNQLSNTLIVVTSDNGMPFPRIKGNEYEYANHLPLAVMWPDGIKNPGRKVNDMISFIDFAPTFLELAGVKSGQNKMHPISGESFSYVFSSAKSGQIRPEKNYVLIGQERHDVGRPHDGGYPVRGICQDNFFYLRNFEADRWPSGDPITGYLNTDGSPTKTVCLNNVYATDSRFNFWLWNFGKRSSEELYNIADDPACLHNLAKDPAHRVLLEKMNSKMMSLLNHQEDPRLKGKGFLFDQYIFSDKNSVNFYERYMAKDTTLRWGWVNDSDFQDIRKIPKAINARNK